MKKLSQSQLEALTAIRDADQSMRAKVEVEDYDKVTDTKSKRTVDVVILWKVKVPDRRSTWRDTSEISKNTYAALAKEHLVDTIYSGRSKYTHITDRGLKAIEDGGKYETWEAPPPVESTLSADEVFALEVRDLSDNVENSRAAVLGKIRGIAEWMRSKAKDIDQAANQFETKGNVWSSGAAEHVTHAVVWAVANAGLDALAREELNYERRRLTLMAKLGTVPPDWWF